MLPINDDDLKLGLLGVIVAVLVTFAKWMNSNRKSVGKLIGLIVSSAIWGGLSAWGIHSLYPNIEPTFLGVVVGVLAHGGSEATVTFFRERILSKPKDENV
jgi:Na+/proline symporter